MKIMMESHDYKLANQKQLKFPGYVSQKFDGTPGRYTRNEVVSRQGKKLLGIEWLHNEIKESIPMGVEIWMEHYEWGKPFSYINGKVEAEESYKEVRGIITNMRVLDEPLMPFGMRMDEATKIAQDIIKNHDMYGRICVAKQIYVRNKEEVEEAVEKLKNSNEMNVSLLTMGTDWRWEGAMFHYASGQYIIHRSWNSLKIVEKPTYDLAFAGCEEGKSKEGIPNGRAGKLYFKDANGTIFGCGPGKMKHVERERVFMNKEKYIGKIATIKSKEDSHYKGLREPTFQWWREDKTEPDEVKK